MLRFFHKVVFYEESQNRSRSEQILQKHRYRSNAPIIGASDNTALSGEAKIAVGNPEVKTTLEMKEKVVKYSVTNKETKREAKMELATQLVQVIDGLGGLDSVTCRGTSSLPARPAHKEGGKLWWELAKESRKKANRKTVNAVYNARDKLLAKNFKRFSQVLVRCASESCGVLSWRENEKCTKCHEPLEKVAVSKK